MADLIYNITIIEIIDIKSVYVFESSPSDLSCGHKRERGGGRW
jgi:hypothetical protein